jgi:hypothetical protein
MDRARLPRINVVTPRASGQQMHAFATQAAFPVWPQHGSSPGAGLHTGQAASGCRCDCYCPGTEDFPHELHTDPENARVFKGMAEWLDYQLLMPAAAGKKNRFSCCLTAI